MMDRIGAVIKEAFLPVSIAAALIIGGLFTSGYLSIDYVDESIGEASLEWFRDHFGHFLLAIILLAAADLAWKGWRARGAKRLKMK